MFELLREVLLLQQVLANECIDGPYMVQLPQWADLEAGYPAPWSARTFRERLRQVCGMAAFCVREDDLLIVAEMI